jgi:hypothetical protein
MSDPAIVIQAAVAQSLARRLEAAADILKRHPCEVYGLEEDCRDAAAIIPLIRASALEEAAVVAEDYDGEFEEIHMAQGDIATAIRAIKEQP